MGKLFKGFFILCFAVSIIIAQTATAPTSGDGSESTPYQIESLENLYWIYYDSDNWDKYYIQTADIDASSTSSWDADEDDTPDGWTPIGNDIIQFTGNYDGQDHTISGIYINRGDANYQGLFGYITVATVENLGVTGAQIIGKGTIGVLSGRASTSSYINSCYSTGTINSSSTNVGGLIGNLEASTIEYSYSSVNITSSSYQVGGLLGYAGSSSTISYCYATGSVTGTGNAGGFIGRVDEANTSYCYSTGDVTSANGGGSFYGGFIAKLEASSSNHSIISNCYTRSNINTVDGSYAGGFVGAPYAYVSIINSYTTGDVITSRNSGRFSGYVYYKDDIVITECFYNTESSCSGTLVLATGKTTAEMTMSSTFTDADWDFTNTWSINSGLNDGYPYLQWAVDYDQSLPVELADFSLENKNGSVILSWKTESETQNRGFIVAKKSSISTEWEEIADFTNTNSLIGQGSSTEAKNYTYTDTKVQPDMTYQYRLADVDNSGKITWHSAKEIHVASVDKLSAESFSLGKAFPNPFNPSVTLQYTLKENTNISLRVYNLKGQLIEQLLDKNQMAGQYSFKWQPQNLNSGVYVVRLQSGEKISTQKIIYLK